MLSQLLDHGHDIRSLSWPGGADTLQCQARSAGHEQRRAEVYSWDGMTRGTLPFLVIQHTILGEGRLDYAGQVHRLTPGQTMLVTMPHAHRYYLQRGGRWEYFWLLLTGREALRMAREILEAAGPVLTPAPALVDRLASACLTLLATPQLTPGQASTAAHAALATLHDAAFATREAGGPALPPGLARVLAHVEDNLAAALTVDRLAGVAGQSRAHFVRQFTAHLGLPPSDFVMARRLERIERLLLATEMTVADIARATGFADGNYLAKCFRRHRGMTPLAWRATRGEAA